MTGHIEQPAPRHSNRGLADKLRTRNHDRVNSIGNLATFDHAGRFLKVGQAVQEPMKATSMGVPAIGCDSFS